MNDIYKTRMQSLSGLKLYKLIYQDFKLYHKDALQEAKEEFKKRNFPKKVLEKLRAQLNLETRIKREKEREVLDPKQKLLFFVFFWSIIPWFIAGTFKTANYNQKYDDAWECMKYGFFTMVIITIIFSLWMFVSLQTY